MSAPDRDVYSHGHHPSVLRGHAWRTAANSAAYLVDHLRPGMALLDVGCGPGTITVGLARAVAPAPTLGIDTAAAVIAEAEAAADGEGLDHLRFAVGNAYAVDAPDATFDVVHAHQVLQHLGDPIEALHELRRVLKPGGLLAVRDADYGAFVWAPPDPRLDRWLELYHDVTRRNGAQADAGRWLRSWVAAAGFVELTVTASAWVFSADDERSWWGGQWADRVRQSSFAEQSVDYGLSTSAELDDLAAAFDDWAATDDATFVVPHVEVLARAPSL